LKFCATVLKTGNILNILFKPSIFGLSPQVLGAWPPVKTGNLLTLMGPPKKHYLESKQSNLKSSISQYSFWQ
jgi:hypothetical protein